MLSGLRVWTVQRSVAPNQSLEIQKEIQNTLLLAFSFLLHLKQNSRIQVRNLFPPKTFPGAKGHFSLGYCCDASTLVWESLTVSSTGLADIHIFLFSGWVSEVWSMFYSSFQPQHLVQSTSHEGCLINHFINEYIYVCACMHIHVDVIYKIRGLQKSGVRGNTFC